MTATLYATIASLLDVSMVVQVIMKATVVVGLASLILRMCRSVSASVRHLVTAGAFVLLLLLPLGSVLIPSVRVEVPVASEYSRASSYAPTPLPGAPPASLETATSSSPLELTFRLRTGLVFLAVWLLGMGLFFVPMLAGFWQLRRMSNHGLPWLEGEAALDRLKSEYGLSRRIRLFRNEHVAGPLTFGVLRPVIVVPIGAPTWTPDALRSAMVHELEHIRRFDWVTHCVSRAVCTVYWFHPLVWMLWRQLRLEAERACDDAVVVRGAPVDYAQLLISVAEDGVRAAQQPLLAMANRNDLSTRIRAVLDPRQARAHVRPAWVVGATALSFTCAIVFGPVVVRGQSAASPAPEQQTSHLEFEVASIKPNKSGDFRRGLGPAPGGRFTATNVPLRDLIAFAYGVPNARASLQITGGPPWLETERFDVEAVAGGGTLRPPEASAMLRSLLEERFNLKVHRETREVPIYNLRLDRADGQFGPRLQKSAIDCEARRAARGRGAPPRPPVAPSAPPQDPTTIRPTCGLRLTPGRFAGDGVDVPRLAEGLAPFVGRLVVDRTGLTGYFDMDLDWALDARTPSPDERPAVAVAADAPGIFTAVREQLGFRLEDARGPVEMVVIDAVDPLEPN